VSRSGSTVMNTTAVRSASLPSLRMISDISNSVVHVRAMGEAEEAPRDTLYLRQRSSPAWAETLAAPVARDESVTEHREGPPSFPVFGSKQDVSRLDRFRLWSR
jgi:hypothetical protein